MHINTVSRQEIPSSEPQQTSIAAQKLFVVHKTTALAEDNSDGGPGPRKIWQRIDQRDFGRFTR